MIEPISKREWDKAQKAERSLHTKTLEEGIHHYRIAYDHNFRFLGINPEEKKNGILEVGCADFPALRYCNIGFANWLIEPMPSEHLIEFCNNNKVGLKTEPFENINPDWFIAGNSNEVWMFNVLQHVADPEKFIWKAKLCKTIRYFEPIDTEITDYHPHSFTKDDFDRWFPGVNKYYNETKNQCFHNGPCCYGVYHR